MMIGTLWLVLMGCPWISVEEHQANMFPTGWTDTATTWDTTTTDPTSTTTTTTTGSTTTPTTTTPTTTTDTTTTSGTSTSSPCGGPYVRFNEIMSRNEDWPDPSGRFRNWVELVEVNGNAADLTGYTVVSYERDATRFWSFSAGTDLPQDGQLVLWGEGAVGDPSRAPFVFSAARGGELVLFDPDDCELDRVSFPSMWSPFSYGRSPDRTGDWQLLNDPTPNGVNSTTPADVMSCSPDMYQIGDAYFDAYEVSLGERELYGTMCQDEPLYDTLSILVDFYAAVLGPDELLTVRMWDGLNTECTDSELALIPTGANDLASWRWTSPSEGCPELSIQSMGWPSEGFGVLAPNGYRDQDYFLDWEVTSCADTDGDGFLDNTCGGSDCAPTNASIYPGAGEDFAQTGGVSDLNCDGVVFGAECHAHDPFDPWLDPISGSVPSLSPSSWKSSYDVYTFDVNAGDCVILQTDVLENFGPHLGLWAWEGGFDRVVSAYTEGFECSRPTWNGAYCPRANFIASQTGTVQVAVGQETSFGPTAPTPTAGVAPADGNYILQVYVNGLPPAVDLVDDDRVGPAYRSPL